MTDPAHSETFEKAITVTPIDANTYSAYLDSSWCIGLVPHGGYTASVLYRAAKTHFARKAATATAMGSAAKENPGRAQEPIALQITFQRRTFAGPAILTIQDIKLGARVSTVEATLLQSRDAAATSTTHTTTGTTAILDREDLEVKILAYITLSPPELEEGPAVIGPWQLSPGTPPGSLAGGGIDFKALDESSVDGEWKTGPLLPPTLSATKQLRIYSPASTLRPKTVNERATQVVDQWAQFAPAGIPARWSNEAVMYLADIFPAALDRMAAMEVARVQRVTEGQTTAGGDPSDSLRTEEGLMQFWYPTVTMNIDLKSRLPPEGVEWLHSRVVTRMLRGSRTDLDVVILDQEGGLVATSTQVALVVDPARNVKRRGDLGKL